MTPGLNVTFLLAFQGRFGSGDLRNYQRHITKGESPRRYELQGLSSETTHAREESI